MRLGCVYPTHQKTMAYPFTCRWEVEDGVVAEVGGEFAAPAHIFALIWAQSSVRSVRDLAQWPFQTTFWGRFFSIVETNHDCGKKCSSSKVVRCFSPRDLLKKIFFRNSLKFPFFSIPRCNKLQILTKTDRNFTYFMIRLYILSTKQSTPFETHFPTSISFTRKFCY